MFQVVKLRKRQQCLEPKGGARAGWWCFLVRSAGAVRDDQRGVAAVVVAAGVVAFMGLAALSVDVGWLYTQRSRLQTVADAAALAGARNLPEHPAQARQVAQSYVEMHAVDAGDVTITTSSDRTRITVNIARSEGLFLGRVLGYEESVVGVTAEAAIGHAAGVDGLLPLGIEMQSFELGKEYLLKLGSKSEQNPSQGNFHALALGGSGASNYRQNLRDGYPGRIHVAEQYSTETGNMKGPTVDGLSGRMLADPHSTYDNIVAGSPRLLLVPLVDSFDVPGRKKVTITGFAMFFLEAVNSNGEVVGRFVRQNVSGEAGEWGSQPDGGVRVARLIQ